MEPVEVVEAVEAEVVVTTAEEAAAAISSRVQAPLLHLNIQELNIRISRLATGPGAGCTSDTGGGRTFVQSQPHARGRMSSFQDLSNETGTSPRLTSI